MSGGMGLEAGEIHHLVKSQDYSPEPTNPTNSVLTGTQQKKAKSYDFAFYLLFCISHILSQSSSSPQPADKAYTDAA